MSTEPVSTPADAGQNRAMETGSPGRAVAGGAESAPPRRQTRQRTAVLDALGQGRGFVSAQHLHDRLRHDGVQVGLATVYRTLQSAADAGELDTVRTDDGETRFRRCVEPGHHHHLVCRVCGRTVELSASAVEAWAHRVGGEHGFTAVEHRVELFGVCSQCASGAAQA